MSPFYHYADYAADSLWKWILLLTHAISFRLGKKQLQVNVWGSLYFSQFILWRVHFFLSLSSSFYHSLIVIGNDVLFRLVLSTSKYLTCKDKNYVLNWTWQLCKNRKHADQHKCLPLLACITPILFFKKSFPLVCRACKDESIDV